MKKPRALPDLPHRDCMVRHAIRRVWQRHGLIITQKQYDEFVGRIRNETVLPCAHTRSNQPVYEISHRNKTLYAIWATEQDCIVTFYPTLVWVTRAGGTIHQAQEATA